MPVSVQLQMGFLYQSPPLPNPRLRGHRGRGSRKKCKTRMKGKSAVKGCSLDLKWLLYTWTHGSSGFSHKPSIKKWGSLIVRATGWESSRWPTPSWVANGSWWLLRENLFTLRRALVGWSLLVLFWNEIWWQSEAACFSSGKFHSGS